MNADDKIKNLGYPDRVENDESIIYYDSANPALCKIQFCKDLGLVLCYVSSEKRKDFYGLTFEEILACAEKIKEMRNEK